MILASRAPVTVHVPNANWKEKTYNHGRLPLSIDSSSFRSTTALFLAIQHNIYNTPFVLSSLYPLGIFFLASALTRRLYSALLFI